MKFILKSLNLVFFLLLSGLVTNCSGDMEADNGIDSPESPIGEYKVLLLEKEEIISPGTAGTRETINSGCDINSTIKFKSNNTFEFIDKNESEDENCSSSQIISGSWESTTSISGGFYGELSFNGTFRGKTMYNGTYSSSGFSSLHDAVIYFDIVIEDQTFRYAFYFEEV